MKYATIVADPPWPIRWSTGKTRKNGRGERHVNHAATRALPYPTMEIAEIAALAVADIAEVDAHLYLWTTERHLLSGDAVSVAKAWGFEPLRTLIWAKTGFGLGTFPRPQHETVLVCRRGRLAFNVRNVGSVQRWKLPYEKTASGGHGRRHSRKPDDFLDVVEMASPGPYIELFARRRRTGWDSWGNEVKCDDTTITQRGAPTSPAPQPSYSPNTAPTYAPSEQPWEPPATTSP